jgi:hypothetical protein
MKEFLLLVTGVVVVEVTRPEDFNSRNVARAENVRREKVNCVTASESGALQKQCSILIRAL